MLTTQQTLSPGFFFWYALLCKICSSKWICAVVKSNHVPLRIKMLILFQQKRDFQLQMQHWAFGGMIREAGCTVRKKSLKCPVSVYDARAFESDTLRDASAWSSVSPPWVGAMWCWTVGRVGRLATDVRTIVRRHPQQRHRLQPYNYDSSALFARWLVGVGLSHRKTTTQSVVVVTGMFLSRASCPLLTSQYYSD